MEETSSETFHIDFVATCKLTNVARRRFFCFRMIFPFVHDALTLSQAHECNVAVRKQCQQSFPTLTLSQAHKCRVVVDSLLPHNLSFCPWCSSQMTPLLSFSTLPTFRLGLDLPWALGTTGDARDALVVPSLSQLHTLLSDNPAT